MAAPSKHLPILPAERALKVISGRWKAVILYHLLQEPRRLSDLTRLMPAVSQKVLIQQLREMEAHGIVHREVFRQVPPRVD
jgi:DNA-binding HxlR family transcriptional regulator